MQNSKQHLYTFLLGKTPLLSIAELCSIFKTSEITDISKKTLSISINQIINDPQTLQNRLGGTLKIIKNFAEFEKDSGLEKITNSIVPEIEKNKNLKKPDFALNIYNNENSTKKILQTMLPQIKRKLKAKNIHSRFINKNFSNLSSASTYNSVFARKNQEFNIIYTNKNILIGETIAIQDIDAYSKRDFNRPARDSFSGMLPPKIAQIMINLTLPYNPTPLSPYSPILFDPFCGSGTILMEGLLMGYNVIGSDISEKAIKDTQTNIDWLKKTFQINPELKFDIFLQDALTISDTKLQPYTSITLLSEPYLGPALSHEPTPEKMNNIQTELRELLMKFFQNLSKILPAKSTIIIIFPYIKARNKRNFLQITKQIEQIGFKTANLIPQEIQNKFNLKLNNFSSLLYERKDQIVGREIWKFEKNYNDPPTPI